MENAHPIGMQATEYGWSPWQDGRVRGAEHTCREHRQRQVQGCGLNLRSGRVIGTYRSSFGEEDLSGSKEGASVAGGGWWSRQRQSGSRLLRERLASQPK